MSYPSDGKPDDHIMVAGPDRELPPQEPPGEADVERHRVPKGIDTVVQKLRGFNTKRGPRPNPPPWSSCSLTELENNTLLCLITTCAIVFLTLSAVFIGVNLRGTETVNFTSPVNPALTKIGSSIMTDSPVSAQSKNTTATPHHNTSQPTPNIPVKLRKLRSVQEVSLEPTPKDRTVSCSTVTTAPKINQNGHTIGNKQLNCTIPGVTDPGVCILICSALNELYGSFHPELAMSLLPALGAVSNKVRWNEIIHENRADNHSVGVNAIPIQPPGHSDDLITPCFTNLAEEGPKHRYTVIPYVENTQITVRLTTCEFLDCGNHKHSEFHRGQAAYLCMYDKCATWRRVFAYSDNTYKPACIGNDCFHLDEVLSLKEGLTSPHHYLLTIHKMQYDKNFPQPDCPADKGKPRRRLVLKWGTEDSRGGHAGIIIDFDPDKTNMDPAYNPLDSEKPPTFQEFNTSTVDIIKFVANQKGRNLWLEWLVRQTEGVMNGTCIACAAARPRLIVMPVELLWSIDPDGAVCYISMFKNMASTYCDPLHNLYPMLPKPPTPPDAEVPKENHYSCVYRNKTDAIQSGEAGKSSINLGQVPIEKCVTTVTNITMLKYMTFSRADIFWYCRDKLLSALPSRWYGRCALVTLAVPVQVLGIVKERTTPASSFMDQLHTRKRRSSIDSFKDPTNNPTYINAIGVPRGVPDEYHLADEVGDGWTSAFLPTVVANKNVARINYLNYNILRLTNFTIAIAEGVTEELRANTQMTIQNRMALDMILAEKGGVCKYIGSKCCVVIPENSGEGGSVQIALEGLKDLSTEMESNSGIEYNWIWKWLDEFSGQWKSVIITVAVIAVLSLLLCMCGPCFVPCIRACCTRCFTQVLKRPEIQQMLVDTYLQMHQTLRDEEAGESSPPPTPPFCSPDNGCDPDSLFILGDKFQQTSELLKLSDDAIMLEQPLFIHRPLDFVLKAKKVHKV